MALTPIEKLKKEAAKANAALQSEKKKNRALKAKNQTLKEENRQLHKKVNGIWNVSPASARLRIG
jgi:cell division protein FtsB